MKGYIIYRSKYGAGRQYAEWLSASLHIPAISQEKASQSLIAEADFLVLGSSIYMGKLLMRSWLYQHAGLLAGKQLFLFLVTATSSDKRSKLESYVRDNVPERIAGASAVYFFPGKIQYRQLSLVDKMKVKLGGLLAKLSGKPLRIADFNHVRQEHIAPLVKDVCGYRHVYTATTLTTDKPVNEQPHS